MVVRKVIYFAVEWCGESMTIFYFNPYILWASSRIYGTTMISKESWLVTVRYGFSVTCKIWKRSAVRCNAKFLPVNFIERHFCHFFVFVVLWYVCLPPVQGRSCTCFILIWYKNMRNYRSRKSKETRSRTVIPRISWDRFNSIGYMTRKGQEAWLFG